MIIFLCPKSTNITPVKSGTIWHLAHSRQVLQEEAGGIAIQDDRHHCQAGPHGYWPIAKLELWPFAPPKFGVSTCSQNLPNMNVVMLKANKCSGSIILHIHVMESFVKQEPMILRVPGSGPWIHSQISWIKKKKHQNQWCHHETSEPRVL